MQYKMTLKQVLANDRLQEAAVGVGVLIGIGIACWYALYVW